MQIKTIDVAMAVVQVAKDKKGQEIVVLGLQEVSLIADYFVIISGTSRIHSRSIAEAIMELSRKLKINMRGLEGFAEGEWILIDYNSIVAHIFTKETRYYYDLERLWSHAQMVYGDRRKD